MNCLVKVDWLFGRYKSIVIMCPINIDLSTINLDLSIYQHCFLDNQNWLPSKAYLPVETDQSGQRDSLALPIPHYSSGIGIQYRDRPLGTTPGPGILGRGGGHRKQYERGKQGISCHAQNSQK